MILIETERLRLRAFESRDAERLARYRSDPTVAVYQSWSGMTLSEAEQLIATPYDPTRLDRWSQIAVADRETDELIGDIGICVRSPGDLAELGVTFAPDGQGKGLAAEACRAAIELLFSLSSVTRIEAIVDARNHAAIALMRRLGMRLDRTEEALFKGEVCSEHHFVLPRFEYFEGPTDDMADFAGEQECSFCGTIAPSFSLDSAGYGCVGCLRKGRFEFWHDTPSDFDEAALQKLRRTPQIVTWQQEQWLTHCRDFMVYEGTWEPRDFYAYAPDGDARALFLAMTSDYPQLWDESLEEGQTILERWHATYYVFRCRHCGIRRGNWDCN